MTTVTVQILDNNDQLVARKEFKDVDESNWSAKKTGIIMFLYENIIYEKV